MKKVWIGILCAVCAIALCAGVGVALAYGKLRGTQPCLCALLFQLFQLRQFFARRRPALVRQRHGLLTSC